MRKIIYGVLLLTWVLGAEEVYATFTVEAQKSANLAFTSSGSVQSVKVDVASEVKKGEVLATLNSDDLQAALNIAKVTLTHAKKEYERQLKVKKLVDAAQFDSYQFKYENAKANVIYQEALLDKTILRAPFDGVIFEKIVEEGDVVSGAMIRTILKIQSPHQRKLLLTFDQKYHQRVHVGDIFTYSVDGEKSSRNGIISKIYPSIDVASRKMSAEVEAEDLPVGLFGDGTIAIK